MGCSSSINLNQKNNSNRASYLQLFVKKILYSDINLKNLIKSGLPFEYYNKTFKDIKYDIISKDYSSRSIFILKNLSIFKKNIYQEDNNKHRECLICFESDNLIHFNNQYI